VQTGDFYTQTLVIYDMSGVPNWPPHL